MLVVVAVKNLFPEANVNVLPEPVRVNEPEIDVAEKSPPRVRFALSTALTAVSPESPEIVVFTAVNEAAPRGALSREERQMHLNI